MASVQSGLGIIIAAAILLLPGTFAYAQKLTIYTEDWPPMNFQSKTGVDGMAVDVVKSLQKMIGNQEPIQLVPWSRGYKAVLEDENVLLFSLGRSPEREKLMHMLGPIAISKTVIYTRKGEAARLRMPDVDIYKMGVGAYRGSIFADAARKKGFYKLVQADSPQNSSKMLFAKRFDLWVEGSMAVNAVLQETGHSMADIEEVMVLDSLELYLAFSIRTSPATLALWEAALRQMKKDGSFQKIHQKWLPGDVPPPQVIRVDASPGN
ncbi:transporter substrate-binding domain-containing protein [Undibacterium sp. TS12]|uniref:substrate-binding periplasmic protein n=1 Tax=Undibacterium sp. TS12 TaxID=2908202 RepID=UPI001F4D2264|nr:transporter substrate-binding domain-containing protein [Undibacterium sp. TS12]MCH8620362.1 transporter substrate-binding domain-containing protein [Undibacterium sp. TS12]